MNDNIKIGDIVVFKPGKSFIPEEELSNNKFVVVGLSSSHVLISFKDIGIIPIERERVEIYKPRSI